MHKSVSVSENETNKIPGDLKIETNPLIQTKRRYLAIFFLIERICRIVKFRVLVNNRRKIKENEKYLDLDSKLEM